MKPVTRSVAGEMDGTTDPHFSKQLNFSRGGERISIGVKWGGGEYEADTCWIKCDMDGLIEVES